MSLLADEAVDIEYSVRVSPRARRLLLKVSRRGEVEVVLPRGVARREAAAFVAAHRAWVIEQRQYYLQQHGPAASAARPPTIEFAATAQCWRIDYRASPRGRVVATLQDQQPALLVYAADDAAVGRTLQRWLQGQARHHLLPWLQQVSQETGLRYRSATVRGQKTRWGSCTRDGDISLNRSLLFLAPELVHYLFIHELCHTRVMSHSARYWREVARFAPDYRDRERALHHAVDQVPLWASSGS
ncbi:MAG: M48 family metallopeptidase [Gammaproteobacteria bacterium]|nr:M48 family metallopeptidase [Gammaproteobacteria bacterium]